MLIFLIFYDLQMMIKTACMYIFVENFYCLQNVQSTLKITTLLLKLNTSINE